MANRSTAARRGWSQRGKLVDHIITITVESKRSDGKIARTSRDLIVPARPGTRKSELIWLAKQRIEDLPVKERYAVDFLNITGRNVVIAIGPPTRGKRIKLR